MQVQHIAEVLAIGDEMTSGERLDTNSQWLSRRLTDLGWHVLYHALVGDELPAIVDVFRIAIARSDLIVATGGLGPTADDLTRQAIAEAVDRPLQLRPEALQHIRGLFEKRGRTMSPRNEIQAMFPEGSRLIPNQHGTAPGLDVDVPRDGRAACRIFAMPGVPAEMHEMWTDTVAPALLASGGARTIRHHEIKCFGVGESDLEQMLPDMIRRGRSPRVGITVSRATITLRVTAEGASAEDCFSRMEPTIQEIHSLLGDLAFGHGDQELQDVVVDLLRQHQQTLSVVEADTGGLLAHWLAEADATRAVFVGGSLRRGDASMHDEAYCRRQLETAKQDFHADWTLVLGSCDAQRRAPCLLAGPHGEVNRPIIFGGHPDIVLPRAAKQALNQLRLALLRGVATL